MIFACHTKKHLHCKSGSGITAGDFSSCEVNRGLGHDNFSEFGEFALDLVLENEFFRNLAFLKLNMRILTDPECQIKQRRNQYHISADYRPFTPLALALVLY